MEEFIGSTPLQRRWVMVAALSLWLLTPASLFLTVALNHAPDATGIVCDNNKTWASPPTPGANATTWEEDWGLGWPDLSWMCPLCGTEVGAVAWDWGWTIAYPFATALHYVGLALNALWGVLTWVPEDVPLLDPSSSGTHGTLGVCLHMSSKRVLQFYAMAALDVVSVLLTVSVVASVALKLVPQAAARAEAAEADGTAALAPRWASRLWDRASDALAAWFAPAHVHWPRGGGDGGEPRRCAAATDASRRVAYPSLDVNSWRLDSRNLFLALTALDSAGFGVAQRSAVLLALELVQPTAVSGTLRLLLSNPMLVRLGLVAAAIISERRQQPALGLVVALFELAVAPSAAAFGFATSSELGTFRVVTEAAVFVLFVVAVTTGFQLFDKPSTADFERFAAVLGACAAVTGVQHWFGLRGLFSSPFAADGWVEAVGGIFLTTLLLVPAFFASALAFFGTLAVLAKNLPPTLREGARSVLHVVDPHLTSLSGSASERLDEAIKQVGVPFLVAVVGTAFVACLMVVLHPLDNPQALGFRELVVYFHPQPLWKIWLE
ncbi:hypothetical protein FNF27_00861 [Cafeteria roenbergensis]|uniref:Uncharacterized protein n=1 Tax=Cafeteria roenbergensis TaxID=33653 RepID=A0A5A8EJA5_CAFRO|nr:hypothetical protein FNF27_00861 [Cafeteria roenbergensis]